MYYLSNLAKQKKSCKKVFDSFGFHLQISSNFNLFVIKITVLKMWVGPLLILVTNNTATTQKKLSASFYGTKMKSLGDNESEKQEAHVVI